ncbi:MAG: DUF11 domain-containing protein, partial [Methanobacteriaceae archaeon]|nr:DUF11 domain-containing protein [Methanobacteriaceae archaeon]
MNYKKLIMFFLIITCTFMFVGTVFSAEVNVTSDGTFNTVNDAIFQAGNGGTIYLNNHSFEGTGNQNGYIEVDRSNIIIDGSMKGNSNYKSTLDARDRSSVMVVSGSNVVLKNLILKNGFLNSNGASNGAGISFTSGSNLMLINCEIIDCEATGRTDAHSAFYSSGNRIITFDNCIIANNTATQTSGGSGSAGGARTGIFSGTMINTLVADNVVTSSRNNALAVGITLTTGNNNQVYNSEFRNNTIIANGNVAGLGAGLQIFGTLYNTTFIKNRIIGTSTDTHGGALCFRPGSLVYNCTFIENHAQQGGATTFHASGVLDNCIFINNTAKDMGGAISTGYDGVVNQVVKVTNSYFEGNSANNGGAFVAIGNQITLENNTFYKNHANIEGGAFYIRDNNVYVLNGEFINNTAADGGAGYIRGNNILLNNLTFNGNKAASNTTGVGSGGAIKISGNTVNVVDSKFTNNSANDGGAIIINGNHINIYTSDFSNNTGVQGGAVKILGSDTEVINSTFTNNKVNSNSTSPGYGGAIMILGSSNNILNSIINNNSATDYAGGVLIRGNNNLIRNSTFDYNTAETGGAVVIDGNNSDIIDSMFNNNTAARGGAVAIKGNGIYINNAKFNNNSANPTSALTALGGAVYIEGNDIDFVKAYFYNNHVLGDGAAVYVNGDNLTMDNTNYYNNSALPTSNSLVDGMGGAIYVHGKKTEIMNGIFDGNSAVNGSAIYTSGGNTYLTNLTFLYNQAYSYALPILVKPKYKYNTPVEITIILIGGNNIANAIYNVQDPNSIEFHNVTYITVNGMRTTGPNEIHPVIGAENSQNGTILYQDSREFIQDLFTIVVFDENGNVVLNVTNKTNIYGNVSYILNGLEPGNYTITSSHPEDRFYKGITNVTTFIVEPLVDLAVNITTDYDVYYVDDEIIWYVTLTNYGPHKDRNVRVSTLFDNNVDYVSYTASKGTYNPNTGIWSVGDLNKNEVVTLMIRTKALSIENTTLTVNATGKYEDSNLTNNVANHTVQIIDLTLNKAVNNTNPNIGENVTYTVTVANTGAVIANNVVVRDTLGAGLEFVSASDNGVYDPATRTITWTVNIAAGETKTFTVVANVVAYGVLNNTVTVGNKTKVVNLTVRDIDPSKVVNNTNPNIGENVEYTITVVNNGGVVSNNVKVVDTLGAGLEFVSASDNGVYDPATRTITWTVNIGVDQSKTFTVVANVVAYGVLNNTVTVGNKTKVVNVTVPEIIPDKTVNNKNP